MRSAGMKARVCVLIAAWQICGVQMAWAQTTFTVEQAVQEAVDKNLSLLAERWNLTIADAAIVTARLRPNPVLSGSADHLDWLGSGFDAVNGAGPPEHALRGDMPFHRTPKRQLRPEVARSEKT